MTKKKIARETAEEESLFTTENREKKALVTLGGTAVTEGGKLTKSNYFRFLGHDLDDYTNIEMSPTQAKKIHAHLSKLSTGSSAMVPLYCGGEKCPFKDRCPLYKEKIHPLGKQCLIEAQLLKEFTIRYFEEFDVNPQNWTEVGYINELAEIDIYLYRLKMLVARPENSELVIDQVVGITPNGDVPIVQKQLSPFMEQMEKLNNRKSKIIKLMVGDRQEKYKKEAALKMKIDEDPSSKQASIRAKLESLQRAMLALEGEELTKGVQHKPGEKPKEEGVLTPEDIIDAVNDE